MSPRSKVFTRLEESKQTPPWFSGLQEVSNKTIGKKNQKQNEKKS